MSGEAWHGTLGGYTNHRCRQECCRAPARDYQRAWKRQARSQPVPPYVEHGTVNAACNYHCPCAACRGFRNAYQRDRRTARKQAAS